MFINFQLIYYELYTLLATSINDIITFFLLSKYLFRLTVYSSGPQEDLTNIFSRKGLGCGM